MRVSGLPTQIHNLLGAVVCEAFNFFSFVLYIYKTCIEKSFQIKYDKVERIDKIPIDPGMSIFCVLTIEQTSILC